MVITLPTNAGKSISARNFARNPSTQVVPNLIELQTDSFEWFKTHGLQELISEVSPIEDVTGTRFRMHIMEHEFGVPKNSEEICREREPDLLEMASGQRVACWKAEGYPETQSEGD